MLITPSLCFCVCCGKQIVSTRKERCKQLGHPVIRWHKQQCNHARVPQETLMHTNLASITLTVHNKIQLFKGGLMLFDWPIYTRTWLCIFGFVYLSSRAGAQQRYRPRQWGLWVAFSKWCVYELLALSMFAVNPLAVFCLVDNLISLSSDTDVLLSIHYHQGHATAPLEVCAMNPWPSSDDEGGKTLVCFHRSYINKFTFWMFVFPTVSSRRWICGMGSFMSIHEYTVIICSHFVDVFTFWFLHKRATGPNVLW